MAAVEIKPEIWIDALLVLGTAGVVVPFVRRTGLSPILGYLAAGAAVGPYGLGALRHVWDPLKWITIGDAGNVSGIAELGVVFLLFLIGLELSFERLQTMRRLVLGLGGLQVVLTSAVLWIVLLALGVKAAGAIVLGIALALSSTAVVIEELSRSRRLQTTAGRASFAVLLAQDLAVIPLLLLIAALGASDGSGILAGLVTSIAAAVGAFVVIVVAGRVLLRPLMRMVAATGETELLIAAVLFVIIGSGLVAALAGVSMALGAFVAGLMLAETEYRKAIEAIIEPFKTLLLGVFFFTIGMKIQIGVIVQNPLIILGGVVGLVLLKSTLLFGLMRLFRVPFTSAVEASPILGPAGEFAFVGIGIATAVGIVGGTEAAIALAVASLSMVLIPPLHLAGRRIAGHMTEPVYAEAPQVPEDERPHTIVVGFGRVGRVVTSLLEQHGETYLATETDANSASAARRQGKPVFFGDAAAPGFIEKCGLDRAKAVVLTIHDRKAIDLVTERVLAVRPDITIFARARDAEHARRLYAAGVSDAVPETIEASLQLAEAVLVGIGQPTGLVIAAIHGRRDEVRRELQQAARASGIKETRAVRAPSRALD